MKKIAIWTFIQVTTKMTKRFIIFDYLSALTIHNPDLDLPTFFLEVIRKAINQNPDTDADWKARCKEGQIPGAVLQKNNCFRKQS